MDPQDPAELQQHLPAEMRERYCVISRSVLNRIYVLGVLAAIGSTIGAFGLITGKPLAIAGGVLTWCLAVWVHAGFRRHHKTYAELTKDKQPKS